MMKVKNDKAAVVSGVHCWVQRWWVWWVYRGRGKGASTLRERGHAAPQTLSSGRLRADPHRLFPSQPNPSTGIHEWAAACRQGSLSNANLMRGTLATASQVTSMSDEMSWDVQ